MFTLSQDWIHWQLWGGNQHIEDNKSQPIKLEAEAPLLWRQVEAEALPGLVQGISERNLLWGDYLPETRQK